MKLYTKLKEENSSKISGLKKSKKQKKEAQKKEWLLSDDQFFSILHSSSLDEKAKNSKIKEILLSNEEEIKE